MEDDKFKDLLEDEELTALRLAALASKKKKEKKVDNSSEAACALPINSIVTAPESVSNQIPFLQSDRNAFNNNYAWRKLNQSMRRRGGAFPFQKSNQRSNLIVISPVVLNEGKDSEKKAPALLLPQHKWSNSVNEDSMSPKTLRKTGPTRFNRHGSDSESSDDSDYEPSDNDSGSNETVLQDEPSEKFSRLSPDSDSVPDDVEKKRRLSFQRLDSDAKSDNFDKTETTSVYNLLKNTSSAQSLSDSRHNWSHSAEGEYSSYKQYNSGRTFTTKLSDAPESFSVKQTNLPVTSNGESSVDKSSIVTQSKETSNTRHHARNRTSDSYQENSRDNRQSLPESGDMQSLKHSAWQHGEELRASSSFYLRDTTYNNSKENTSKSQLSESDLRLELKKRMQDVKSQSAVNDSSDTTQNRYDQRNASENNRLGYAYEESKIGDAFDKHSVNKQESSNLHTDKFKQSFSDDQDYSTVSRRNSSESHKNDLMDNFAGDGKRKFQYSERSRYNRCSSLGRSRNDGSPSRDRNRHDRSSSWDRRRDRSSSKSKSSHTYREDHSVKSRSSVERNFNADKKNDKFKSSQKRRLSERSSSRDRSNRHHSSSSESSRSRSRSRERNRRRHYSSRNNRSRSMSRDRSRRKRSLSRNRRSRSRSSSRSGSRYSRDRSRSRGSRSDRSRSRGWSKCSSSQDESRANRSASKNKSVSQNSLSSTIYSVRHKIKCSASVSQDQSRKDSVLDLEQGSKNSTQMLKKEFEKSSSKEQFNAVEESRLERAGSSEKTDKIKRSPRKFSRGNDSYKDRDSRSRSSSSESYSSSVSSSSSYSSKPKLRSVPSVITPVVTKKLDSTTKETPSESKTSGKSMCSAISKSDTYPVSKSDSYKKNIDVSDSNKLSTIKCRIDGDLKVSDNNKRVPVHMRLGVFPRKRLIQMPKDVEAAFVNTSSSSDSENVNTKCKRQNFRIVTNVYDSKTGVDSLSLKHLPAEKPAKRSPDMYQEKSKHLKAHR